MHALPCAMDALPSGNVAPIRIIMACVWAGNLGTPTIKNYLQRSHCALGGDVFKAVAALRREPLGAIFKSFDRIVSRAERNCANLRAPGWVITIRECELEADAVNGVDSIREELRKDG